MSVRNQLLTGFVGLTLLLVLASPAALANPGFSRKYEMSCNTCHTSWPNLNDFGREFKVNGFRLAAGHEVAENMQEIDDRTWVEKLSIVSGKINGRLYDKSNTNTEFRLRAFHELELYIGGNAGNVFSYLVVIEAEDEPIESTFTDSGGDTVTVVTDDAFNVFVDQGIVGYHPTQAANIVLGWGSIFSADPYNSLADGHRRLTRSHKSPLDRSFDSGFALRKPTQFLTFNGRAAGLYYSASMGAGNSDPEGTDDKDFLARVAYDFPVVSIGGFYLDGTNGDAFGAGLDQGFMRTGFDFNIEAGNFQTYGLYMEAEDDVAGGTTVTNASAYVEALYTFNRNDQPSFYPLVRWEEFEGNNGVDSTAAVVAVLGWYVRPNINLNIEHFKQISVPGNGAKGDRTTFFFNIGL
jgi:hypothetical protein